MRNNPALNTMDSPNSPCTQEPEPDDASTRTLLQSRQSVTPGSGNGLWRHQKSGLEVLGPLNLAVGIWRDRGHLDGTGMSLAFSGFELPFIKGITIEFEANFAFNCEQSMCDDWPFVGLTLSFADGYPSEILSQVGTSIASLLAAPIVGGAGGMVQMLRKNFL